LSPWGAAARFARPHADHTLNAARFPSWRSTIQFRALPSAQMRIALVIVAGEVQYGFGHGRKDHHGAEVWMI
jgi:hypothetical protein